MSPSEHSQNQAHHQEPEILARQAGMTGAHVSPEPAGRQVTIRLVASGHEASCHFWIGLAAQGAQNPSQLMDLGEMDALLTEAATVGINENGPVMLSDTNASPPRYVYLMPTPELGFRERSIWIDDLSQSLTAWAPQTAGFYIAPQLMTVPDAHTLLLATLTALIQASNTKEYVLLTGAYGLNALLNVALQLKNDLDGESLRIAVYH